MITIFVYGTLLQGGRYHHLLAEAELLGPAQSAPHYQLLDLGPYPGLVPGVRAVSGELYRISSATLAALDDLEGHPRLYRRATIALADGREVTGYLLVDPRAVARGRPIAAWPP